MNPVPHKKKDCKKSFFTIIELMICLVIIALTSALFAPKIYKAVERAHYESSYKKIKSHIDLCQKIASLQQTDIYFTLSQDEKELFYSMSLEGGGFFRENKPRSGKYKGIFFLFNGKRRPSIELIFSSSGEVIPKGQIKFFYNKDQDSIEVDEHAIVLEGAFNKEEDKSSPPIHPDQIKEETI